jgi:mannose-6-phosphate isomerase-like protein (cupin superfamily)
MVLEPGKAEGNSRNRHNGADQWLFVLSGTGTAKVNRRRQVLKPGTLLLIERGDRHEIRNDGAANLVTLNVYVPPAYTAAGKELPAGKPADRARTP